MKPPLPPDDSTRDPLAAYADGDPDAVRAARPHEPTDARWEVVRRRVQAQLGAALGDPGATPRRWRRGLGLAAGATLAAAAAAVAWVVLAPHAPPPHREARELVEGPPAPVVVPVAPVPHDSELDPLAAFAVLPMADADDVVLHRVPGDGWLPVGTPLLSGAIALAGADDVELEDPDPAWPSVSPAPGYAPMIFAAKPR